MEQMILKALIEDAVNDFTNIFSQNTEAMKTVDNNNTNLLMAAAHFGSVEIAYKLMAAGVDVNDRNNNKESA